MSHNGIPSDLAGALDVAARVPRLLLSSDYDGCISPLVSRPEDAVPNPASITAIVAAAGLPDTVTAVVSGRELAVLAQLSGLTPPVHLIGSHGSEFDTGFVAEITDEHRSLLERLIAELRSIAADYQGSMVETKPASTVIHVRNAARADADAALERTRSGPATWPGVQVTEGKEVIELAVIETSKGHALDLMRERFAADAVIYLGDDVTDEKAFAHLRTANGDIGIKVGDGDTVAGFRITDTHDVAGVLEFVVAARQGWLASR
ncbi:trehalose-phosphatase [Gordonia rhizosphera]|uniref:Trehalose 6-phosphate phosphatase n=1 Tax=Gordonia rhizosphera NBRC 16068 TaxID=1108045 RepID=K6W5D9_9ACTN|nr:trehalose-phosphatase [Gordonia rhizosphera]GAB88921.1 trehalose-phosphatase [Gordonia rhizosphera NBRC 16068]